MRSTKHLSDDDLRKLAQNPISKSLADRIRKARIDDRRLLALNLREMERRESDPNYDPADDPTCVPVKIESDEE